MPTTFIVREHVFDGQHIREYHGALSTHQEDIVKLHAKSYTPLEVDGGTTQGDLTLVACHANGVPKECYEPLFRALYIELKSHARLTIGSIWILDQAFQNMSASLNDERMGNDAHWFDHSRDILLMVNTFRTQMKRPIIGMGHSLGASQLAMTAHFHPRLFEALVMIDPALTMTHSPVTPQMIKFALKRPRTFKSQEELETYVRKSPYFASWDPEVLELYITHAWHDSPTVLQPDRTVKARTSLLSDVRGLMRVNAKHVKPDRPLSDVERYNFPDVSLEAPLTGPVYNPSTRDIYQQLRTLRPATLFLLGQGSKIAFPEIIEHRAQITGTGVGGSGGVAAGNVSSITIPGGHFVPLVNIQGTAEAAAEWISQRIQRYRAVEETIAAEASSKTKQEKQSLPTEVLDTLRNWDGIPWPNSLAKRDGGASKL